MTRRHSVVPNALRGLKKHGDMQISKVQSGKRFQLNQSIPTCSTSQYTRGLNNGVCTGAVGCLVRTSGMNLITPTQKLAKK